MPNLFPGPFTTISSPSALAHNQDSHYYTERTNNRFVVYFVQLGGFVPIQATCMRATRLLFVTCRIIKVSHGEVQGNLQLLLPTKVAPCRVAYRKWGWGGKGVSNYYNTSIFQNSRGSKAPPPPHHPPP